MASIADYYPAGMSECEIYGINGNCGVDCPVFQRGGCDHEEDESEREERSEEPVLAWQKWGF